MAKYGVASLLLCVIQPLVMGDVEPMKTPYLRVPMAKADAAPKIDANPDDPAWTAAAAVPSLMLARGGSPAMRPLPTEVRLLWNADWLFVRFSSAGPEPYAPFGTERDAKHYLGDVVEVFLDPVGDGRQYFELQQSPAGGLFDQNTTLTAEAKSGVDGRLVAEVRDRDYWPNPGYEMPDLRIASTSRKQGDQWIWTADFALPAPAVLKRLGKKTYEPMKLRANLVRYHNTGLLDDASRRLIAMNWSPVVWGCPHQSPAAMGTLELVAAETAEERK